MSYIFKQLGMVLPLQSRQLMSIMEPNLYKLKVYHLRFQEKHLTAIFIISIIFGYLQASRRYNGIKARFHYTSSAYCKCNLKTKLINSGPEI